MISVIATVRVKPGRNIELEDDFRAWKFRTCACTAASSANSSTE